MLTVCGQQHQFSSHERMFFLKVSKFLTTENVSTWGGFETPSFGFMSNALNIWAIRARHLLSQVSENWRHQLNRLWVHQMVRERACSGNSLWSGQSHWYNVDRSFGKCCDIHLSEIEILVYQLLGMVKTSCSKSQTHITGVVEGKLSRDRKCVCHWDVGITGWKWR